MSDVLSEIGITSPTMADVPKICIAAMEAECKLWQFTLEKHHCIKEKKIELLEAINIAEKPVIDKIRRYLTMAILIRNAYRKTVGSSQSAIEQVVERCRGDMNYFVNNWCNTIDPRMVQLGLVSRIPFVLFDKQLETINTMDLWYRSRLSGMIEKSREEGVTWMTVAYVAWHFLFTPGFTAILGSEKEEKVDVSGSNDTLFGKLRFIVYDTPKWLRPKELADRSNPYDKQRLLVNPDTGNEIKGEIGDNIGRSGRASMLVIDEYQDIVHPDLVRAAVSSTANCKIYIGTIKGMNHFYKLKESGEIQVQNIWWYHDPRKNPKWKESIPDADSPWRKHLEATEDKITIAQEYDGNPNASVEGSIIPAEWVEKAVEWMSPPEGSDLAAGFDVSSGRNNEAVYIKRTGPVAAMPYISPFKTIQDCAWSVIHKGTDDGITILNYDMDGVGESLIGMLQGSNTPIPFKLNGLRGNGRASDDIIPEEGRKYSEKYANRRAERWFSLRKRFERTYEHRTGIKEYPLEQLISIPNDRILITQLSQPLVKQGNRLGVESKLEMKARHIPSPDRADALVYTFTDYNEYDFVVPDFDYTQLSQHCQVFTVNHEIGKYEQYVSIHQGEDNMASVVVGQWFPSSDTHLGIGKPLIRVFGEITEPNADPEEIIQKVSYMTRNEVYPVKEWVANAEMFGTDWQRSPDRLYAKNGVRLKKNYEYDESGSMIFMNYLIKNNQIIIHANNCSDLIMQLSQWRRAKGKPAKGLNLAKALCNMLTRLRENRRMNLDDIEPEYYKSEKKWLDLKRKTIHDYLAGNLAQ